MNDHKGGEKASRECPECHSKRIWKDGIRKTRKGSTQRFVCRDCWHRFSESSILSTRLGNSGSCQVCAILTEAKNLTEVEPLKGGLAGATKDDKSLILEYAWQMKKRGLAPSTITQRVYRLRRLAREGAKLTEPNSISEVLALSSWTDANKRVFIVTYKSFAKMLGLPWSPPKKRVSRKLPFIPTEVEIDQLIRVVDPKLRHFYRF